MQSIPKEPEEIAASFQRIDKNADGSIEIEEFSVLMLEMDHRCRATDLRACFQAIDSDHDGRVTFEEFRAWLAGRTAVS
jgi:Ca2+-binding EF-hand superfamily protein